jgi:hypothetical protein
LPARLSLLASIGSQEVSASAAAAVRISYLEAFAEAVAVIGEDTLDCIAPARQARSAIEASKLPPSPSGHRCQLVRPP